MRPRSKGRGRRDVVRKAISVRYISERFKSERIQRWAFPASLAVTEGILVSFFSSA